MTEPVRIRVAAEKPYDVLIGRGLLGDIVEFLKGTGKIAIVHQPTLAATAEVLVDELKAVGADAHRVEIPDAEDGKDLAVAGFDTVAHWHCSRGWFIDALWRVKTSG